MIDVTFISLSAKNFLSIGKDAVSMTFPRGMNVITGENLDLPDRANGIGKTTLVNALNFVLYGETIKALKQDSIVNDITKKGTEVELVFSIKSNGNIENYKIIRKIKPSKLFLYKNNDGDWNDITLATISDTNSYIADLIQIKMEVFQNRVIMTANDTVPFMAKSKIDKRKFVEGILDLEIFGNMLKKTREEYNTVSKTLDVESGKFEEQHKFIDYLETRQKEYEIDKKKKIQELNNSLKELNVNKDKLSNLFKPVEISVDEYKKSIDTLNNKEEDYNNIISKIESLEREISKLTLQENNIKEKIAAFNIQEQENKISVLESSKTNIEKKDFETLADEISAEIKKYKDSIQNLTIQHKTILIDISSLEKDLNKLNQNPGNCQYCNKNIGDILKEKNKKDINVIEENIKKKNKEIEDILKQIEEEKSVMATLEESQNTLNNKKKEYDKVVTENSKIEWQINQLNQTIKDKEQELTQNKKALKDVSFVISSKKEEIAKVSQDSIETLRTKIKQVQNRRNAIQELINEVKEIEAHNKLCRERLDDTKKSIETTTKNLQEVEGSEFPDTNTLNSKKKDLVKQEHSLNHMKERIDILSLAKLVFSEEGVKSFLVKKILDTLNSYIGKYLKLLDAPCIVKFNELFEDEIYNLRNVESSYWNFSGAERKMIDLSIMFAFIDIMKVTGRVNFNTIMFDELLDSSVDSKGIELIINILKDRVSSYGEAIYVISHRKEISTMFNGEVVFLQKKNGLTTRKNK